MLGTVDRSVDVLFHDEEVKLVGKLPDTGY
jgi:hypothetical protein